MSNYRPLPSGTPGNEPPKVGSRATGAVAGAVAGAILPLGPIGPIAGAVLGGVFGPRSRVINNVSDKAVAQLGKWAGRR